MSGGQPPVRLAQAGNGCGEFVGIKLINSLADTIVAVVVIIMLFFGPIKQEAEDLSTALFNRTADTNKFLRADANIALDAMTDNITPAKAVIAIVHKGCR